MGYSLEIFIDESGDPGVRDGMKYFSSRHEWLCIGAVAVRAARDAQLPDWINELRHVANSTQSGALHYERVSRQRREAVCARLATKPAKLFVLATHKSNMREYINPRVRQMLEAGTFYNWCLRLLLERVTAWAERWYRQEGLAREPLRVVFARRGHDYEHFFSYVERLRMQKQSGTLFLKGPGLNEPFLDQRYWEVRMASELAGLQLADVAASAFYQAANTASPAWDIAPAKALGPIVAGRSGNEANYGVTAWPLPHQATLPDASRPIFREYGYKW